VAEIITVADIVSLAEVKTQLHIRHSDDDVQLGALIKAATVFMTQSLRAPVSAGTWLQRFPGGLDRLELEVIAADPVTITYFDADGVSQNFTTFSLHHDDMRTVICADDDEWPDATSFVVQYAVDAPAVDDALKVAAMMHVAVMYETPVANLDNGAVILPMGYAELIAPHRRF
jgi:uncharacterized phiE125 gp8 family phage protein